MRRYKRFKCKEVDIDDYKKEIDWHYYVLPFGFICYDCGKKIINHLQHVVKE